MLQRSPSVIKPGGLEGGGFQSGFLKNGDRREGFFKDLESNKTRKYSFFRSQEEE